MYDLVFSNCLICDGNAMNGPFMGNVAVDGDTIRYAGISPQSGVRVVNCEGMILCPGFIDMHSHSDEAFLSGENPESKIFQGITTEIVGQCGISIVPNNAAYRHEHLLYLKTVFPQFDDSRLTSVNRMEDYISALDKIPMVNNCIPLVGHGALRIAVMGFDNRRPDAAEMSSMQNLLDRELESGAWGMSLGLIYPPGSFAETDELVELGKVVARHDGIIHAHVRGETSDVFAGVAELIEVGRRSGARVHVSHLKLMGRAQWGRARELVGLIEDAKKEGITVSADQYPYEASQTGLTALLPKWAQEGGVSRILERLEDEDDKVLQGIAAEMDRRGGPERVRINSWGNEKYDKRTVGELSRLYKCTPTRMVEKILVDTNCTANAIYFSMAVEDVDYIMRHEGIAVGTDGYAVSYDDGKILGAMHPRSFGTFPRFFAHTFGNNMLPIHKAVAKITGLPASIMKLGDRGFIKKGQKADLVLFDPERIKDTATFDNPYQKPEGIKSVFVNGSEVVCGTSLTESRPGRVLAGR